MSAYIEPHRHIATLARWAVEHDIKYFVNLSVGEVRDFSDKSDEERYVAFANILEKQNVRSVDDRYDEVNGLRVYRSMSEGVRTLEDYDIAMACAGYKYQSCETTDWENTDAFWLIYTIEERILGRFANESPYWSIQD